MSWEMWENTHTAGWADALAIDLGSVTAKNCAVTYYRPPHRCCVEAGRKRANQHGFVQEGRCCCGKTFTRRVLWSGTFEDWRADR